MYKLAVIIQKVESPEELRDQLFAIAKNKEVFRWVFRGQGRPWPLLPSLWRLGMSAQERAKFEHSVVETLRKLLKQQSGTPARFLEDENYILSIAQHFGQPTSLLDWSFSSDIACYFAAAGALRQSDTGNMSIFALGEVGALVGDHWVQPPHGTNENIRAQKGLFYRFRPNQEKISAAPERTVDDAVAEAMSGRVTLIRFDLNSSHAWPLLSNLVTGMGVDASHLFPGHPGFAHFAADIAWASVQSARTSSHS